MGFLRGGAGRAVEWVDAGAEADERVLDHLARLGCDPASPRATTHFVYLTQHDDASQVAAILRGNGWQTRLESCADDSWLVVAHRVCALSSASVRATRRMLEGLAAEHRGVYDGWEAQRD